MPGNVAIWWIRRDLRLDDNRALTSALTGARQVIPLYILDDRLLNSRYVGEKRYSFLLGGLHELDRELRERNGRLILRRGDPSAVLAQIIEEARANEIFAEEDFSPFARSRDAAIHRTLPLTLIGAPTVAHPMDILKRDGTPYTVYTPYARRWKELNLDRDLQSAPGRIEVPDVHGEPVPREPVLPDSVPFTPGMSAGNEQLESFTTGAQAPVFRYGMDRDRLDLDATSRLSPYFRFGMISARRAALAATGAVSAASNPAARKSAEAWLSEIIWRDFYGSILYHFPHVRTMEFKDRYREIGWINDPDDVAAWTQARTGYPVVDACMRQMHSEGWMHNRGRMITASFLVKHLLIDWRLGEQHFMKHLVDGDPASNNGGWQWTAGTGNDAAPYFRIFNPILQGKRHDPEGEFVRHWVPELREVETRYIHEPWKMPESVQVSAGCRIGRDYPEPIVDHKFARERAIAAYREIHQGDRKQRS